MKLCQTCKHAQWFDKGKVGGLCRHPFDISEVKMPYAVYFLNQPYMGRIALHKKSSNPQECSGYEYSPKAEGRS